MSPLSPKITRLASAHRLGTFLEEYISSSEMVLILSILATLAAIGSLYSFAAGAVKLSLIFAIALAGLLYGAIARNKLYVFEEGLVLIHTLRRRAIRYDRIEMVWRQIIEILDDNFQPRSREYLYTIRDRAGKTFMLRNQTVGDRIQREIFRHKMPQLQADYQRGETLNFSALALSRQGLSKRQWYNRFGQSQFLPWSAVAAIRIEGGMLTIWQRSQRPKRWLQVAIHGIPNFVLLEAFLEEIIGIERGGRFAKLSFWNQLWQLVGGGLKW